MHRSPLPAALLNPQLHPKESGLDQAPGVSVRNKTGQLKGLKFSLGLYTFLV